MPSNGKIILPSWFNQTGFKTTSHIVVCLVLYFLIRPIFTYTKDANIINVLRCSYRNNIYKSFQPILYKFNTYQIEIMHLLKHNNLHLTVQFERCIIA